MGFSFREFLPVNSSKMRKKNLGDIDKRRSSITLPLRAMHV
jgi:hypothetical protein